MTDKHFQEINQTIYNLEELGLFKEAEELHSLFIKEAAKKSKKKKNVPNNPSLWAECKAWAKRTFDVYPSAYANGAAAKRYKSKGGTWRKANSENTNRFAQLNLDPLSPNVLDSTYGIPPKKKKIAPATESNLGNVAPGKKPELTTVSSMPSEPKTQIPDVVPVGSQGQYGMPQMPSPEKPQDNLQSDDPWSGYKEMPYKDVIEQAKKWVMSGDVENADSMIQAVTQLIRGSKELNAAQKDALKKHYERIKFSLQDTGRLGSGVYNQYYKDANDLIARAKAKFNLPDKELTTNSPSYGLVLNEINNFVSNLKNPEATGRTKNIAFSLLRQLAMDNYKTMKQQGITPR